MLYTLPYLKGEVRTALDNNSYNGALMPGVIPSALDAIIRQKIEDAARDIVLRAPHYLLGQGCEDNDPYPSVVWEFNRGRGRVPLPDDFWRLFEFRMSNWRTSVFDAITADSPEYYLQSLPGVKGSIFNPVVAIIRRGANAGVLEFYGTRYDEEAEIAAYTYIPKPEFVSNGQTGESLDYNISFPETLLDAIKYQAAALTAAATGEGEVAKVLFTLVSSYLQ